MRDASLSDPGKLKADLILDELAECQKDNGGQWAGPIPEKYLHWIATGKGIPGRRRQH